MGNCTACSITAKPSVVESPFQTKTEELQKRILIGIKQYKAQMDMEQAGEDSVYSFAKIVLKLGTIRRVLSHIQLVEPCCREDLRKACDVLRINSDIPSDLSLLCGGPDGSSSGLNLRELIVVLTVARLTQYKIYLSSSLRQRTANNSSEDHLTAEEEEERCKRTTSTCTVTSAAMERAKAAWKVDSQGGVVSSPRGWGGPTFDNGFAKWARIPSINQLRTAAAVKAGALKQADGNRGVAGMEAYSSELRYVLDLIIASYLVFDSQGDGFISRKRLEKQLEEAEGETGTTNPKSSPSKPAKKMLKWESETSRGFMAANQWGGVPWKDGKLGFEQYVWVFSAWIDIDEADEAVPSIWDKMLDISRSERGEKKKEGGVTKPKDSSEKAVTPPESLEHIIVGQYSVEDEADDPALSEHELDAGITF